MIIAGGGKDNIATQVTSAYTRGGYSDCFLPSLVELEFLVVSGIFSTNEVFISSFEYGESRYV
jgi:hypothetical protein